MYLLLWRLKFVQSVILKRKSVIFINGKMALMDIKDIVKNAVN
jgi:hypothetical protein